jgi:hypothetical protein
MKECLLTLDKGQIKGKNASYLSFYITKRFCACDVSLNDLSRWITKRRRWAEHTKRNYETDEQEEKEKKKKKKKGSCLILFTMFIWLMLLSFLYADDLWSVLYE